VSTGQRIFTNSLNNNLAPLAAIRFLTSFTGRPGLGGNQSSSKRVLGHRHHHPCQAVPNDLLDNSSILCDLLSELLPRHGLNEYPKACCNYCQLALVARSHLRFIRRILERNSIRALRGAIAPGVGAAIALKLAPKLPP
jgi:hypothetical protein